MTKKYPEIIRHRTVEGYCEAGWMTPQFLMQITPLNWGFSFVYCSTKKVPTKVGIKVGCVSLVLFVGKAYFDTKYAYHNREHVTYGESK